MSGESSYVEHAPTPALDAIAWSVWIQQVGDQPLAQRHEPQGGAEIHCVLGEARPGQPPRHHPAAGGHRLPAEYDVERHVSDYAGWLREHDR